MFIRKIFKITQPDSGWTDSTRSIVGVEISDYELVIEVISGANLHETAFIALLRGPLAEALKHAAGYERTNPIQYKVERGMSGRRAFVIRWIEEVGSIEKVMFNRLRRKEVLYISGFRKIEKVDCFLPDLIPFLPELNPYEIDRVSIVEVPEVNRDDFDRYYTKLARDEVDRFLGEEIQV